MLSLFSGLFHTATRQDHDDLTTTHLRHHRRPLKSWEVERLEAERRRRNMKNIGMW